jgi:tetratricopeptide (TPR) repeat protein
MVGKLRVGFILFMVSAAPVAAPQSQDLRLVDPGSSAANLKPSAVDRLPLEPALRVAIQQALKDRDYQRAETILVDEIDKNPKSPQLLTFLGSLFFLDGKYLDAAIGMKKADAIEPLDDRDRFTLALSYILLNRRDWARPELEKLARANPDEPLYPYRLGRLGYDAMQFKAAAANLLGLTYEALAQYDDAIRIYQQALDLNRRQLVPSPWPPLNLGTLLIKLERLKEAESCLQESLRYEPRFPKAHLQMGVLLGKEKKDDEAIRELGLATQFGPTDPEPHYILGKIYQRTGDKAKAAAEWETFQKLKKEHPRQRPR